MTDKDALEAFKEFLEATLPKSSHKKIDVITEHVAGLLSAEVNAVAVTGSRVAVDTIKMFGLEIGLDSYGNATSVYFPYGATVESE